MQNQFLGGIRSRRHLMIALATSAVALKIPVARAQVELGTVQYQVVQPSGYTDSSIGGGIQVAYGTQVVGSAVANSTSDTDAIVWSGPSGTATDLSPIGFTYSTANATAGSQQVGYGVGSGTGGNYNALLWSGTAASAINLNPSGYVASGAFGLTAGQQVGYGFPSATSQFNAVLWSGSAASAVNLNPTGFASSSAYSTDGTQEVGYGYTTTDSSDRHALMWSGTAASAVDLQPATVPGLASSIAYGVGGNQEVGVGNGLFAGGGGTNAMLWTGTASSAVDLNPTGIQNSNAYATNGIQQVGVGDGEAVLWGGTAASAVNLQSLLPVGSWTGSTAYSINAAGDVFGIANGTYHSVSGTFAVEWTPVTAVSWASPTNGNWATLANWNPGVTTPTTTIGGNFTTGSATPYKVTLTGDSSANTIAVSDNVTIQNPSFKLTVPNAVTIAGTSSQHSLLALAGSGTDTFGSLNINSFGQLDITNTRLYIDYGSGADPISSIASSIASGYAGGTWTGLGIVSTAAQTDPAHYGIGYADAADPGNPAGLSSGQIEIMYTLLGDANLSGVVDGTDFGIVAANFNKGVKGWDEGDFNYDNVVDGTDFGDLAANFNKGASGAAVGPSAASNPAIVAFAEANGLMADVPEPASVAFLAIGTAVTLARRRRLAPRRPSIILEATPEIE